MPEPEAAAAMCFCEKIQSAYDEWTGKHDQQGKKCKCAIGKDLAKSITEMQELEIVVILEGRNEGG